MFFHFVFYIFLPHFTLASSSGMLSQSSIIKALGGLGEIHNTVKSSKPSLDPMNLILFDNTIVEAYGSRCLDGSPSGYYFRKSLEGSDNFVIHLEGGGLCIEAADCWERAEGNLGSSKKWSPTHTDNSNVLSTNTSWNPFALWNHVWVPYCGGDVHTGLQKEKNMWNLYFAGHLTIETLIDHLLNTTDIHLAEYVLLTGDSAGGIGVFHNADWLTQKLRQVAPLVTVKASPQAGFYFPSQTLIMYPEYAEGIKVPFAPIASSYLYDWFGGPYLDQSCQDAHPETPHQCWNAFVHYPYITTPLFIAQNKFDSNQIGSIMGLDWWPSFNATKKKGYKRYFGSSMVNGTKQVLQSKKADGLFLISCYTHTGNLCMRGGSLIKGVSYRESLFDWVGPRSEYPHQLVEACPGEDLDPCNPKCDC